MSAGLFAGRQFSEVSIWALCIPFIYVVIKKQGIDNNTHNNDHMCIYIYICIIIKCAWEDNIHYTDSTDSIFYKANKASSSNQSDADRGATSR